MRTDTEDLCYVSQVPQSSRQRRRCGGTRDRAVGVQWDLKWSSQGHVEVPWAERPHCLYMDSGDRQRDASLTVPSSYLPSPLGH